MVFQLWEGADVGGSGAHRTAAPVPSIITIGDPAKLALRMLLDACAPTNALMAGPGSVISFL